MTIDVLTMLIISIISYSSFTILTFSLFRMPLLEHHRIIAIIGFVLGTVAYVFRYVFITPLFSLIVLCLFISLIVILKRYPIFYSALIVITGYAVTIVLDLVVSLVGVKLHFSQEEYIKDSLVSYCILFLSISLLQLVIAYVFQKYKLGFSFIIRRFYAQHALKKANFFWAGILIICAIVIQLIAFNNVFSFWGISLVVLTICLFILLLISYRHNKKALRDRYGR